jgi:hypothetical protein
MNKILTFCLLLLSFTAISQNRTWIGGSGAWDVAANWSPAGVPMPIHNVIISGPASIPQLMGSVTVNNLTMSGGAKLDLNTDTLTVTSSASITTVAGLMPKTGAFNGVMLAGRFTINNAEFTDIELEKIGGLAVNSAINGATIFNGNAIITNNSTPTAPFNIGNSGVSAIVFNGPATFNRNNATVNIAGLGSVTFHDKTTLNVIGAGNAYNLANQGTLVFNDTVFINSAVGGNINIGSTGGVTAINAPGAIQSNTGYSGGVINITNLTQNGTASNGPISPATLRVTTSTFGGNFSSVTNSIDFSMSTFNRVNNFEAGVIVVDSCDFSAAGGSTTFTKNAAGQVNWPGSNTFHGNFVFNRNITGAVNLANTGGNTFLGDVLINNNVGNSNLYLLPGAGFTSFFHGDIEIQGLTGINFGPGKMEIAGAGAFSALPLFTHNIDTIIMNADSSVFELLSDVQIRGQLTLSDGIISSASSQLRLLDNATVVGGADSSHVDGAMIKIGDDAFTFPIGDNGYYAPLSISAPLNATDTYFAQYYKQNPLLGGYPPANTGLNIDHVSVKEYWAIAGGLSPLVITLSWDYRSGGVTNPIDLRVVQWNGIQWADMGNGAWTGTPASGAISTSGVLIMGPPIYLTLASSTALPENPLPIELLTFTARPDEEKVLLEWTTATETGNAYFTIERSKDGRQFEAIAQVPGAGNSASPLVYALTDENPLIGQSYYRLRQTDYNGDFSFSNMESVFMNQTAGGDIQYFPNPVSGMLQIYATKGANLSLLNAFGQQVATAVEAGEGYWQLDTTHLPHGMYVLQAGHGNRVESYKVVVR